MKSHLLKPAPFDKVELPDLNICLTQKDLQQEVDRHITNELLSHRSYQSKDSVETGDIVTVTLNQKKVIITVGSGLFDTAVEKEITGKKIGQTAKTDTMSVTVEKIERLNIPSLTDSWVKSLNIDKITTVGEYKEYLSDYYRNFYFENYLLYFAMEFFLNWMQESEWFWDEEEIDNLLKEYRDMENRYLDAHDTFIDGSEEELEEAARENMMEAVGHYLYLQYTDPERAPKALHFETQDKIEEVRSLALRPMIDFLKDKVRFTETEEDA